jgi:Leucine-rich repeat (LRR) protein
MSIRNIFADILNDGNANHHKRSQSWISPSISCIVILVFLFISQMSPIAGEVPPDEIYALNAFFDATNGDHWLWRNTITYGPKWNFTDINVNPCNTNGNFWQGIECSRPVSLCAGAQICHITSIYLERYRIQGTLPTELENLSELLLFDVESNEINGTIPEIIGKLTNLEKLDLSKNNLSGGIPSTVGDLSLVTYLDFCYNTLTGPIPSEVGNMSSVQTLLIHTNLLTGTIPSTLGKLTSLLYLYLDANSLSGTIPSELGNMSSLEILYLYLNVLTGPIPSELGNISSLEYLYLDFNALTGTIPSALGNLKSMLGLDFHTNSLSGSIPPELGNMNSLIYFYLHTNLLTGTIPSTLGKMTSILYLYLEGNSLSGTIPSELGNITSIQYIDLCENSLSGTIPNEIENLKSLVYLQLNTNNLVGTVPPNIGLMTDLQQLFLQQNHLTGSIFTLFENGKYKNMTIANIDFSDNRFSGTIPDELFLLPYLETVALTKNCFTGTLPSSMCNAHKVSVFSMDGLGAAEECKHTSSLPFMNVLLGRAMYGSIPKCIMLLNNITVLSLSANGFTGSLPELREPSSLVNLSLSHNYISGTIPSSISHHFFQSLDLSYNKIHGYVDSNIPSNAIYGQNSSLILAINRLSGDLPDFSGMTFHSLDILSGNIFGCDNSVSNDENSDTYVCGSQELNQSLISLCALLGILALSALSVYMYSCRGEQSLLTTVDLTFLGSNLRSVLQYYTVSCDLDKSKHPNLLSMVQCLRHLSVSVWIICLSNVVLTVPIYVLKGLDYDKANPIYATHSIVYMWEMTTAYITGQLPGGLLLLAWFGSVCVFVTLVAIKTLHSDNSNSVNKSHTYNISNFKAAYVKFSILLLLNIFVVGVMNGFYVYLTLLEFDVWIHTSIQILFAFIKYIWNFLIVPGILFSHLPVSPYRSWLILFVNMLNSVFIPCIASSFTSTSCFQVCLHMLVFHINSHRLRYVYHIIYYCYREYL